ncbi:MAG TPA: cadherin-like domain-containing protein, partial [Xanthomonadaceae bacterium]|nr:cadherin-like domain-containing protein [Xanthomonadaceae bacterium]
MLIRNLLVGAVVATIALAYSQASSAATHFHVYLDHPLLDGNCGATFANAGETFSSFDRRVRVRVGDALPPIIEAVDVAYCQGGAFSVPQLLDAGIPVGEGNGAGGGDVVEFQVPLHVLQGPIGAPVRVAFAAIDDDSGSEDVLATVDGSALGDPILLGIPTPTVPIPLLSPWLLIALAGLLALIAVLVLRRHPALAVVLLLGSGAGVAWAAHMVADGQIGDWAGIPPLATDPQGDSVPYRSNTDMLAAFGTVDELRVFFRIDVVSLTNTAPVADPQSVSLLEDTSILITLTGSDADGDPIGDFAIASPPARGQLQNLQQDTPAPGQAQVTYVPDLDEFGADSFTFTVNDGQVDSAPATVSITIIPVNDPPSFTATDPPAVLEDAGPQSVVGWSTFSPGPPNESDQNVLGYFVS